MDTVHTRSSRDTRQSTSGSAGSRSRFARRALLLLALAVATVTLTQCQMVGDKLTGVQASVFKRDSDCVKACVDARKDADKAEKKLHKDNVKACADNPTCLNEEEIRHEAAQDAIKAAFKDCLWVCHNQGGGGHDDH